MLNDQEKKELKFYKNRTKLSIPAYLFFTCLMIFFTSLLITSEIRNYTIKLIFINFIVVSTIDLFLSLKDERAYSKLFNIFLFFYMFTCLDLNITFLVFNNSYIKYTLSFQLLIFISVMLSIITFFYVILFNNSINEVIQNGTFNPETGIYNFFKKKNTENSMVLGYKAGAFGIAIPGIGAIIAYILGYKGDLVNIKQAIQVIGLSIFLVFFTVYLSIRFSHIIQLIRYEKKEKKKIYTGLIKYIRMEDEINSWRRSNNLKPIKIKSPFFFGDIEK